MTTTAQALKLFFDETDKCPTTGFQIEHKGNTHMIDSDFVINLILNVCNPDEQRGIQTMIVKLDFVNAPILPFLEHLAIGYVHTTFK